ncbi:hypothetical protein Tco_1093071 [Tanacetum coccineum]|uniref:Uncharacterized protein n=1 Tax=Tanacetum coccineum TaxID=301880 RepID=A0ABQ5IDU2_9ASTR
MSGPSYSETEERVDGMWVLGANSSAIDRVSFKKTATERFPFGLFASFDLREIILDRDLLAKLDVRRSHASLAVKATGAVGLLLKVM